MRLIHLLDLPEAPWRNGGGVTCEIAAYRDPAVHPDFLWRVSMATVNAAGPFSRFEGVDRSIAVLDGEGLVLRMNSEDRVLTPSSAPFAFPGEAAVEAEVIGVTTSDLNAMTRRGHFVHTMRRITIEDATEFVAELEVTMLVCMGPVRVERFEARRLDAIVDIAASSRLHFAPREGRCEVLVIEISRA